MGIIKNTIRDWFNGNPCADMDREHVISAALDTPEGRVALAQAMTDPIRRALEYQVIGRRLMMVEELPQGALARYEMDMNSIVTIERSYEEIEFRFKDLFRCHNDY